MTTEEDFQRMLDDDPTDDVTRLVFADWLDERGDPRGRLVRALVASPYRPRLLAVRENGRPEWTFFNFDQWTQNTDDKRDTMLPSDLFERLTGYDNHFEEGWTEVTVEVWRDYPDRRAAEAALLAALDGYVPEEARV